MATTQKSDSKKTDRWDLSQQKPIVMRRPRIVPYGPPGIGKTTFGTSPKNVLLIPTEQGALSIDVPRLPIEGRCTTWEDVLHAVGLFAKIENNPFEWLCIDTITGVAQLAMEYVLREEFKGVMTSSTGNEGYNAWGKGASSTAEKIKLLLSRLEWIWEKKNIGIILLAHEGLAKSGNALGEDFQKFCPDMEKKSWALIHGWCDVVGHACREVRAAKADGSQTVKGRAVGSQRWLVFEGDPARDAKRRVGFDLPNRIELDWGTFEAALAADPIAPLIEQILEMYPNMSDEIQDSIKKLAKSKSKKPTKAQLGKLEKTLLERIVTRMAAKLPKDDAPPEE